MIFLRPYFLLGFLMIPLAFYFKKRGGGASRFFSGLCEEKFLPYLVFFTKDGSDKKTREKTGLNRWLSWLWCMGVLALSGPSFKTETAEGAKVKQSVVLTVDLSPTMPDDMIQRLQFKIYDALKLLKGKNVGLVLYDGQAYTAVPLTEDGAVIENLTPLLSKKIMPDSSHSRAQEGLKAAQRLLEQANVASKDGQILLLTGGVLWQGDFFNQARSLSYPLKIIGFGNGEKEPLRLPDGGFIKEADGRTAVFGLQEDILSAAGRYHRASLDDSDLKEVFFEADTSLQFEKDEKALLTQHQDFGIYLVLLAAPFVLLLCRKGVLAAIVLGVVTVSALPVRADPFLRPDQEAYLSKMQAVEAYRKGEYQTAADSFALFDSAEDLYNQANAKAFIGQYQEAVALYEEVLKKDASHQDAAFNKEYLEKQLKNQEQKKQQTSSENSSGSSQNKKQKTSSDQQEKTEKSTEQKEKNSDSSEQKEEKNSANREEQQKSSAQEQQSQQENSSDAESNEQRQQQTDSDSLAEKEQMSEQQQNESAEEQKNTDTEKSLPQEKKQTTSDEKTFASGEKNLSSKTDVKTESGSESEDEKQNGQQQKSDDMPEDSEKTQGDSSSIRPADETPQQRHRRQWLEQVPDDPSFLLRARLRQQYRKNK